MYILLLYIPVRIRNVPFLFLQLGNFVISSL